jgi:hypothetical protein
MNSATVPIRSALGGGRASREDDVFDFGFGQVLPPIGLNDDLMVRVSR